MKICGTEVRPLRARISARNFALPSTFKTSTVAPLLLSKRPAIMQYGQNDELYICILGELGCVMTISNLHSSDGWRFYQRDQACRRKLSISSVALKSAERNSAGYTHD